MYKKLGLLTTGVIVVGTAVYYYYYGGQSPFSTEKQDKYTDFIIKLKPQRLIFNPGTENKILAKKLNTEGIFWENACNLVLLATNQYQT